MALLFDANPFMPATEWAFQEASWFRSWNGGPYHLHEVEPGAVVYLVDVGRQRIVWSAEVTHMVAVPYEGLGDLISETQRRWGVNLESVDMTPGGFTIGWRARPIERLDRAPLSDDPALRLDGWQYGDELTPEFRRNWGLPAREDDGVHLCAGRAPIGWFAA